MSNLRYGLWGKQDDADKKNNDAEKELAKKNALQIVAIRPEKTLANLPEDKDYSDYDWAVEWIKFFNSQEEPDNHMTVIQYIESRLPKLNEQRATLQNNLQDAQREMKTLATPAVDDVNQLSERESASEISGLRNRIKHIESTIDTINKEIIPYQKFIEHYGNPPDQKIYEKHLAITLQRGARVRTIELDEALKANPLVDAKHNSETIFAIPSEFALQSFLKLDIDFILHGKKMQHTFFIIPTDEDEFISEKERAFWARQNPDKTTVLYFGEGITPNNIKLFIKNLEDHLREQFNVQPDIQIGAKRKAG